MLVASFGQTPVGSEALCVQILSHDKLTVEHARNVYRSVQAALNVIATNSKSASTRATAAANIKQVQATLDQVAPYAPADRVNHTDPQTFCIAVRNVETVARAEPMPLIVMARTVLYAALQTVWNQLTGQVPPSEPPKPKPESEPEKPSNRGPILAIVCLGLVAATLIAIDIRRGSLPARRAVA